MRNLIDFYRSPLIWGSHLLGALIAWFAPDNVLSVWPFLKSLTGPIDTVFPIVGNYASRSQFPEVTELYFAVMSIVAPLWAYRAWQNPRFMFNQQEFEKRVVRNGLPFIIFAWFVVALFFPLLALFGLFVNPGYDFNVMPINRSRLALGFFGPVFSVSAWLMLAFSVAQATNLINIQNREK